MTLGVMEAFGVRIGNRKFRRFDVQPAPVLTAAPYAIEPDASAASYFFALAAITGGTVTVEGLGNGERAGRHRRSSTCSNTWAAGRREPPTRRPSPAARSAAVDVDMNAISDTVMTLAVVALFADGVTRIRNVGHIRHKETDRIAALATELRKLGATVDEQPDGLVIVPPAADHTRPDRHLRRPPDGHVLRPRRA